MTHQSLQPDTSDVHVLVEDTFALRRDTIDAIANIRAKTIRVGLFGRMIYLPDPKYRDDKSHLDMVRDILLDEVAQMARIRCLLTGTYTDDDIAFTIREWIFEMAQTMPHETDEILRMVALSEDVAKASTEGDEALAKALDDHMKRGRGSFHEKVTRFCNGLWTNLDAQREKEAQGAAQRSQAVSKILSRLEYIGKHVRLVSLNASVEAARAGDAGRGLAVIATEFKTLAEEIQSLATSARVEIDQK